MTNPYGPLTIGRLTLTEDWTFTQKVSDATRTMSISGQEAVTGAVSPTQAQLRAKAEGLLAYDGAVVPVVFTAYPQLTGWYRIGGPSAEEMTWDPQNITVIEWSCDLTRVGRASEVEVESRLVGGNRTHASAAVAELWHAAPPGHDSYYVGTSSPGFVDRTSSEGTVRCYRAIPGATNPRYSVAPSSHLGGAARITVNSALCTGLTCDDTPTSFELSNGIIRVTQRSGSGVFNVAAFGTSTWGSTKVFDIKRGSTSLGAPTHITLLRNDPCETVIRLTWDHAPGRSTVDLSLARGARHVGIYVQQFSASSALRLDDNIGSGTVSNQLSAAGYITTTTNDGDTNQWVMGSTVASTAAGTFGFAANVSAVALSAYIGVVRAGSGAAAGDTAAVINAQFLGNPAQSERVVRR